MKRYRSENGERLYPSARNKRQAFVEGVADVARKLV